ncbi:MAG TPA: hypothetical protein VFG68_13295 [Fimbriiglobus sp.]|nr:hypothetical protein [Fimbriiglobus sp.]
MWDPPPGHPLRRMFAGITEHAFLTTLGVADPPLIDYLSLLLSRFVHADAVYRLRDADGRQLGELTEMVVEAEKLPPEGRTRREYHRHIGDFALFWSGVFPEAVNRMQAVPVKDHRVHFTTLGKRSYYIASTFDGELYQVESLVLRRLSEQFELCAYGLREVRREWEELARQPPGTGLIG